MRRVVHPLLQGSIEMREGLCAAGEPETFAEVVSTAGAVIAIVAHDTSFDGDALAYVETADAWTDGGDDAGSFVAED